MRNVGFVEIPRPSELFASLHGSMRNIGNSHASKRSIHLDISFYALQSKNATYNTLQYQFRHTDYEAIYAGFRKEEVV